MTKNYGVFSQKFKDAGHVTHIYRTPDGRTVEVSAVDTDPSHPNFVWDDKEDLGEVSKWLRQGQSVGRDNAIRNRLPPKIYPYPDPELLEKLRKSTLTSRCFGKDLSDAEAAKVGKLVRAHKSPQGDDQ